MEAQVCQSGLQSRTYTKQLLVRLHPKHQNNHTGANNLEIELRRRPSDTIKPNPIVEKPFRSYQRQFSSLWFPTREKDSLVDLPKRERGREGLEYLLGPFALSG